jgi:hypothetical protein
MARRLIPVLILGLGALALADAARATESRNQAMQSRGWMIEDDTNIWMLPAEVLEYSNVLWAELPTEVGLHDYAGGHLAVGRTMLRVMAGDIPGLGPEAVLLGRVNTSTYRFTNVPEEDVEHTDATTGLPPDGRVHALWGLPFGDDRQAAIGLDYFRTTWADELHPSAAEGSPVPGRSHLDRASLLNLNAGLAAPLGPFERLSLGLRLGLPDFEGEREITNLGSTPFIRRESYRRDGGVGFGVAVRGILRNLLSRDSESFLFAQFESGALDGVSRHNTAEAQEPAVDSRKEMTQRSMTLGWSNNHHFSGRLLAVWAAAFEWSASRIDVEDVRFAETDEATLTESRKTTVALPLTVAAEGWLRSWWAARFSSSSTLWNQVTVEASREDLRNPARSVPENRDVRDSSAQAFSVGTTLRFGGFWIDGVVNRSLLYDGPYFLGGSSTGLMSVISVGYRF